MIDVALFNNVAPRKHGVCFIQFAPNHFDFMQNDNDEPLSAARGIDLKSFIIAQASMGTAITALVDSKPVAIFGCVQLWAGNAEFWSVLSSKAKSYPIHMTKIAKLFMDVAEQSLRLHRLQITVRCDNEAAVRWAHALGFEIEGLMRMYLPDHGDAYIMGRI